MYTYDRRADNKVTFEFPTSDAAADFCEELTEPCVRNHRVVDVQGQSSAELKALAKKYRGYESL